MIEPTFSIFDKNNRNMSLSLSAFYKLTYNQFDMHNHEHATAEIMYVQSGKAEIVFTFDKVNYETITLYAGQFIFIDSGVRHKLVVNTQKTVISNCEFTLIKAENKKLPNLKELYEADDDFKYFIDKKIRVFKALDNHFVFEMIQVIQKYMITTNKSEFSVLKASSLLSTLLLCIGSSFMDQYKLTKKNRINTALNYIHNNYTKDIKMQDVADCCNISCNYLNMLFKQTFYASVTDYINQYRIKLACDKMARTDLPLSVIMNVIGFNNKMTFNRNFIKFKNVTPGQYKKTIKKETYEINVSKIYNNE